MQCFVHGLSYDEMSSLVGELVKRGCDVNGRRIPGCQVCLRHAVSSRGSTYPVFIVLLEHGVDVNAVDGRGCDGADGGSEGGTARCDESAAGGWGGSERGGADRDKVGTAGRRCTLQCILC